MPVTSPPATIISEARLGSVVMPPLPSYHPTKKGRGLGTATSMTYDPNDPGATWNQKSPSGPVNVLSSFSPRTANKSIISNGCPSVSVITPPMEYTSGGIRTSRTSKVASAIFWSPQYTWTQCRPTAGW